MDESLFKIDLGYETRLIEQATGSWAQAHLIQSAEAREYANEQFFAEALALIDVPYVWEEWRP